MPRPYTSLLAVVVLPVALTGCGVGLNAETYKERTAIDAANQTVGQLALRDVAISPPPTGQQLAAGSDASATLTIVNPGPNPDRLTSVTSDGAASVDLLDRTGQVTQGIDIPAFGSVGPDDFSLQIRGLKQALWPAQYLLMTFTFAQNGSRTFHVPVRGWRTPLPRESFSPPPAGGE